MVINPPVELGAEFFCRELHPPDFRYEPCFFIPRLHYRRYSLCTTTSAIPIEMRHTMINRTHNIRIVNSSGSKLHLRFMSQWFLLSLFCVLISSTVNSSRAIAVPTVATWLQASDGNWTEASNWSTNPLFPNNGTPNVADEYAAVIQATGGAYEVSIVDSIVLSSLTIDSPDATLSLDAGQLTADTIDIANGVLSLGTNGAFSRNIESEIIGAEITGNAGELLLTAHTGATAVFNNVTLGLDVSVPTSSGSPPRTGLVLREDFQLTNNATLSLERGGALLQIDGSQAIDGNGEIVFRDTNSSSFRNGIIRLAENTTWTVGSGVTIRTQNMIGSIGTTVGHGIAAPNIRLINNGLLSGEGDMHQGLHLVTVDPTHGASFENNGVVQAINNGRIVIGGDWTNSGIFRIRDTGEFFLSGKIFSR